MTQDERKAKIDDLNNQLAVLVAECKHNFASFSRDEFARCLTCGEEFGWLCSKSPDSVCHYRVVDGKVKLVDGSSVACDGVSSGYGCVFCGLPAGRT